MNNGIDIVVIAVSALSLILGARRGLIPQLCSLAGIVIGIWAASRLSSAVGSMLGLGQLSDVAGYVIVLVVVLILMLIVSSLTSRLVRAVGLGLADRLGGALLGLIKCLLLLSLVMNIFLSVNSAVPMVSRDTVAASRLAEPVASLVRTIVGSSHQIPLDV